MVNSASVFFAQVQIPVQSFLVFCVQIQSFLRKAKMAFGDEFFTKMEVSFLMRDVKSITQNRNTSENANMKDVEIAI